MAALLELPLFPLRTVVFPFGRIPLQVFEPRYTQLLKACIRDQSLFGIVHIEQGNEVRQSGSESAPCVADMGTRVHVVDWFSLEHGLLGAVVEGQDCFQVDEVRQAEDGLLVAQVQLLPDSGVELSGEDQALLSSLWSDLRQHPQLQGLGYPLMPETDAALLGSLLQVLPMTDALRSQLLAGFGAECLEALKHWLHEQGVV